MVCPLLLRLEADGAVAVVCYWDPVNQIVVWPDIVRTLLDQARAKDLLVPGGHAEREDVMPFGQLLSALRAEQQVIIVIDPVDRIALPGELDWLPKEIPPNVRLVVTAASDPASATPDQLLRYGFHVVELDWLTQRDRWTLITGLVAQRGKLLRASARGHVIGSRAAGFIVPMLWVGIHYRTRGVP